MLQIIQNARKHPDRIAIRDQQRAYTYAELLVASERVARALLRERQDLNEARVAYMVRPGFEYVSTQWGIWRAGGIAVPICVSYPLASVLYVVEDAQATQLVATEEFESLILPVATQKGIPCIRPDHEPGQLGTLPEVSSERGAMILYTSGTTGSPKGVVSTHANIEAQIATLVDAWEWQPEDHILNVLPLHHVHGIINVMSCALWAGACCQFLLKFSAEAVFDIFRQRQVSLFMAVPTIYHQLISYWESLAPGAQAAISDCMEGFRLMVSGSAALPVSVMEKWQTISGHTLLERYGMTEIGMAISNPYRGERRPGHIGQPLPGVQIRLADEQDQLPDAATPGEIQVKGPNVFHTYWNKPEATRSAFTPDGWFRTGDIAILDQGSYKILGRNSVDIIKSGGYKISALEIEEVLRTHPQIRDCGVVGIPDEEWGEKIAASLVTSESQMDFDALTAWLKERLPGYKVPRQWIIQTDLPRNAMGKVTKQEIRQYFL
jgi:malonyl-CoA/methylmalonyl-CoA synthetase